LTASSRYTSDASSTTITSERSDDDEEDSYLSDGAWLMSKSEGQIALVDHDGEPIT
jgi:hypothetical protein